MVVQDAYQRYGYNFGDVRRRQRRASEGDGAPQEAEADVQLHYSRVRNRSGGNHVVRVSGSRSRHNSGQAQWQRTDSGNYRKPKMQQYKQTSSAAKNIQEKSDNIATNKVVTVKTSTTVNKTAAAQLHNKSAEKKNHVQTKDKSDIQNKKDTSSKPASLSKKVNSFTKSESIAKGTSDTPKRSSASPVKSIPKTAPVPVPQSPTASSR
ncbi:hypothetical protein SK128_000829 [Halocaridina rubra]|uniref:Uncharacterized protein n=1 Tax=Halocaridina rubra TaxID=373956 RepID=A0AAN9AAA6_HALRR